MYSGVWSLLSLWGGIGCDIIYMALIDWLGFGERIASAGLGAVGCATYSGYVSSCAAVCAIAFTWQWLCILVHWLFDEVVL